MRHNVQATLGIAVIVVGLFVAAQTQTAEQKKAISFKGDVAPIIDRVCLPCHAEDSMNPSGLSLDSYDQLMAGGKHGSPIIPGKPDESILIKKLGPNPPFGDRMPLQRRASADGSKKKITEQEIAVIKEWIAQGAKNN